MVCHIFSDIVRVPQFERPNPDAETPEEIVPDTDEEAMAVFDFKEGKVLNQTMD